MDQETAQGEKKESVEADRDRGTAQEKTRSILAEKNGEKTESIDQQQGILMNNEYYFYTFK